MSDTPKILLTPEDCAEALSQSRSTIYERIASGELPSVKFGRSRRITRDALEAYVATLTKGGDAA